MKRIKPYFVHVTFMIASITASLICSASPVNAQITKDADRILQEKIPVWLSGNDVPAAGIGLIENGEIKYVKVFGDLKKGVPAPDNTIFNVASITKTIVTILTLKLVETGRWDLNEPLCHYWVDPDIANDPRHKKLTTRDVLTHQTGFPNWRRESPDQKLAFEFTPGTKYQYSGEGFEYLRHALENKFRKSLEELTDSLIFKPLAMKDTHQSWDSTMDESRFALWHDNEGNRFEMPYKTGVNAAADLLTTVEDYCKFGIYVMEGADLSETLFNEMVAPQSNIQKHSAFGLGWFIVNGLPDGEYAIYHMGGSPGVKTMAVFLPKSKCGIVIFTNGDNGFHVLNNVIKEVFDTDDDIYKYMWERPDIPKIIDVPDEVIKKYTGHYQYPDLEIVSRREKEITISLIGLPKLNFYPEAENKFFTREYPVKVEFVKDAGVVTKLIFYLEGKKAFEANKLK